MAQNLLQVTRICFAVVLSYFDAGLSHGVRKKSFYSFACSLPLLLLLLKCVAHPKKGCKTSTR